MSAHTSPRPLYSVIKADILARIRSGELSPGAPVPSENRLVSEHGVSRMTANRALRELADEGVLTRLAGKGTFVAAPRRLSSLIEIRDIADEIATRGQTHGARVLTSATVASQPAVAEIFATPAGSQLYHVILLHLENGHPLQIEDRFVNPAAAPEFLNQDFATTTPTAYLVAKVAADGLEHTVEAVAPSAEQCRMLNMEPDEPCLRLERKTWARGMVVTWVRLTWPASRYALRARYDLHATGSSGRLPQ